MSISPPLPAPPTFLPTLSVADPVAAHWLRNVTRRLRREISWLWHERGVAETGPGGAIPPFADRLEAALDLSRHALEKQRYFADDETAAHLSRLIEEPAPVPRGVVACGTFGWVVRELELTPTECFLLALAISPVLDSAAGPVYAACLNDPLRQAPTAGLAQRLWDRPDEILALLHPSHALFTHGLLMPPAGTGALGWDTPLLVPAPVAVALVGPACEGPPAALRAVAPRTDCLPEDADVLVARLRAAYGEGLRLVPVIGSRGSPLAGVAAALAARADLGVASPAGIPAHAAGDAWLGTLLTLAWLHRTALYLELDRLAPPSVDGHGAAPLALPFPGLPVTVFVGLTDRTQLKRLPAAATQPPVILPPASYAQRLGWWQEHLPGGRRDATLAGPLADCARRFRCERDTILGICDDLRSLGRPVRTADLVAACRADVDLGDLAQPVAPRFKEAELMLPPRQTLQLREIIHAMRMLTTVHYEWGTDRAWGESGLSALFAGPPGTGKTMAAEVIAAELDLPLYRIDLSQVVNKYIGETEKNLRRLFDAAERSDVILFFDEADSLFGKRTEVKDAHDRYANLEVSYLLERMERFKGLAILATNRKKDLDEAFLRRLRFLIDFPLPGVDERLRIWRQAVPAGVDVSGVDFPFLAQRFPVAGGHIRSIVFHACLQAAEPDGPRQLTMESLVAAVKREYDKLDRAVSLEQYGPFAAVAQRLL